MAGTAEELDRLAMDAVSSDRLIWAGYFFSHPFSAWEQRQSFRQALRDAGFTGIGTTNEVGDDPYWHHWSHTIRHADPDELRAADESAARLAREHGVRYDEWMIFRSDTGELRPASSADAARLANEDARSFEVARRARERRRHRSEET
jgi:nicotinamide mononucleotide adenylyltransferase